MPRSTDTPNLLIRHVLATVPLALLMIPSQNATATEPSIPTHMCDTSLLRHPTGFEMHFDTAILRSVVGQHVHLPIVVRFPQNGTQLHQAKELQCEGLIPSGTRITQIQITQVSGLPRGVSWRSAKPSNLFSGGETACFLLEGTPMTQGKHTIDIGSVGTGLYMGLSSSSRCNLRIHHTVDPH